MKATLEIPDDLYRKVKAKSIREGRGVGAVTVDLFRLYVGQEGPFDDVPCAATNDTEPILIDGKPAPPWFGIARRYAHQVNEHSMEAIRESIAHRQPTNAAEDGAYDLVNGDARDGRG